MIAVYQIYALVYELAVYFIFEFPCITGQ